MKEIVAILYSSYIIVLFFSTRVCYIFGPAVTYPVHDVTPTYLTPIVLSTLRQVDYVAHSILQSSGQVGNISQMPVILIPIHFDRDVVSRNPSCQRSAVIRTFITHDFMTGIPATPNKHLPLLVSWVFYSIYFKIV